MKLTTTHLALVERVCASCGLPAHEGEHFAYVGNSVYHATTKCEPFDVIAALKARIAELEASQVKPGFVAVPASKFDELRDSVKFLDKVKAATTDEQIAVGTDAWDRIENAIRAMITAARNE